MNNIFDSHAHYDSTAFDDDRKELVNALQKQGVCGVINCAADLESCKTSLALAEEYPFIYAACGVHPEEIEKCGDGWLDSLREYCKHKKCVAVGEIGLDYHYNPESRDKQLEFFEKQIILANELELPVIVHDREAHEDTLMLLKKHRPEGVLHCFSGSVEMAKEVLKLGIYIGLGGAATFKNARKPLEVASMLPDDRMLIETDCPYMAPVPFRGHRNDSSLIPHTAQVLAEVRGTDVQSILNQTRDNANTLFNTLL